MKGSRLVKILTTTIFAVALLTTVTPKEVKAASGTCSRHETSVSTCKDCCIAKNGHHTFSLRTCTNCGYTCEHENWEYGCASGDTTKHIKHCLDCLVEFGKAEAHSPQYVKALTVGKHQVNCSVCHNALSSVEGEDCQFGSDGKCVKCGYKKDERTYGIGEEAKQEASKDASSQAFGGRSAEQLSLAEQKTAVSYALSALRASGNALPANTVKTSGSNNGNSDVAAVVADNRDAVNQQAFAQAACSSLGFSDVTPLKTYNMYSLYSTYDAKNKSQVVTWSDTGLKYGDTAFVVWYNQKLGKIELLPAAVGADGTVAVSVPALGDCSTMTVVKASK